jgi:hypothetical protein
VAATVWSRHRQHEQYDKTIQAFRDVIKVSYKIASLNDSGSDFPSSLPAAAHQGTLLAGPATLTGRFGSL